MKTLIHHARVIADGYREIACGGVLVENGRILALFEESEFSARVQEGCEIIDAQGGMLTPGFIVIHIHGAAGRRFVSGKAEAAESGQPQCRSRRMHGVYGVADGGFPCPAA